MVIYTDKQLLQSFVRREKKKGKQLGFVPTMGALHRGHMSLVEMGLSENDFVVVSIFVNPTQFDNQQDLDKYPRIHKQDQELLESLEGEVILYIPDAQSIYGESIKARRFTYDGLEHQMEGAHRKGHFDGVGTILTLLFDIVEPDRAYFGEKDFQQLQIVKKLVEKHHISVEIIGCPIVREANGLAMSSRNRRLSKKEFEEAAFIYKVLMEVRTRFSSESISNLKKFVEERFLHHELLKLEYFEIANEKTLVPAVRKRKHNRYRGFIAVHSGSIRLIDNVALY
ncbi:pantoate--beta-alanine ligase [Aureitalea sp. L0-47]|uniref:pantoate--beta-alanine ligase n=1 Tax=Aureitalea sp. L0-47 TaxID=2816962 RepID=UPI002238AE4D|nr:pantoate--beta-alanine ligase [Aureitalea sp. L0-47]MCW5518366.1 pantoate--beta-alanine ligase [Aureitalea sp. L0-47]